jgi:peptidoglycan/xylan/chitin deacetylase (PgdA/CDA1 family)
MGAGLRILVRPLYSAGSILCLHSVTTPEFPSDDALHVPLTKLRDLVRAIRAVAEIVPLVDLIERHRSGRSTGGMVALTFDDAYAAMLTAVEEVLSPEGVPATIFAVSDALSVGHSYWWDRLSEVVDAASPERWLQFRRAAGFSEARHATPPRDRFAEARSCILSEHAGRLSSQVEGALAELESDLRRKSQQRSMTLDELRTVARMPGIHIGVHTRSHAMLPSLSEDEAVFEIADCYQVLRAQVPDAVPILAVPFGLFDRQTDKLAKQAGMDASLTLTGHTLLRASSSGIPRFCLDRWTSRSRVLLRTSWPAERLRVARGGRPDDLPELPTRA